MWIAIGFIGLYWAVALLLARRSTTLSSADGFLMGRRNASWLFIASALFTLVGGGELVTLTALAFTYGWPAISLFLGYCLGFIFLGFFAHRLHSEGREGRLLSLHERAYTRYGSPTARLLTGVTILAFFSLLVVQFTAAGQIVAPLISVPYNIAVVAAAGICLTYLLMGGFEVVLATDLVQAFTRVILIPILVYALWFGPAAVSEEAVTFSTEGATALFISLTLTGFFSAAASADVWQRIYAARSAGAARLGLFVGGIALFAFGWILVSVGERARVLQLTDTGDTAFAVALAAVTPYWLGVFALLLVLATILSTADTEMFLVGGMLSREIRRARSGENSESLGVNQSVGSLRWGIGITTVLACIAALILADLITVYTWLISALLVIAPATIGSIFFRADRLAGSLSIWSSAVAFAVLAFSGILKPETAYLIIIPGTLVYFVTLLFERWRTQP